MKKTSKFLSAILAAAMSLSLVACGGDGGGVVSGTVTDEPKTEAAPAATEAAQTEEASPAEEAAPAASGATVLNHSITTTPDTCDPARGSGENDDIFYVNVYEALVKPAADDGSAEPWLAEEWSYDEAAKTYTFKLREDACFADGTPLTAKDVVYTMDRFLTMNDGYSYLIINYVDKCEAVDDYTVNITLKETFGPFISAMEQVFILNSELVKANTLEEGAYGENGDYGTTFLLDNAAGSGAYVVEKFEVNASYVLAKNPNWWGETNASAPDKVVCTQILDAATTKMMLQNGDLDIVHGHQEAATVSALKAQGFTVGTMPEFGEDYFMFNVTKAPMDDVNVRRAVRYACDYESMATIYGGAAPATGPIPEGLWGYTADVEEIKFDMEAAAAELAKSQYADNIGDYPVNIAYIQGNGETGKLCMLLAEKLQELGFTVALEEVPWVTYCDNETSPETAPAITNCLVTAAYPEAGSLLEMKYASWTLGNYNQNEWLQDTDFDNDLLEALKTVDDDERAAKYAELQKYIVNDVVPSSYAFVSTLFPVWNADRFSWPGDSENMPVVRQYSYYYNDFVMK